MVLCPKCQHIMDDTSRKICARCNAPLTASLPIINATRLESPFGLSGMSEAQHDTPTSTPALRSEQAGFLASLRACFTRRST